MFIKITDKNMSSIDIYTFWKEVQLRRIYEPKPGIFIGETSDVILRAMQKGYVAESLLLDTKIADAVVSGNSGFSEDTMRQIREILEMAGDVPVYVTDLDKIDGVSGLRQSRGILCALKRRVLPDISGILEKANRIVILEDVENPTNVGAIFRSAAGMYFDGIILTHGSADPLYKRSVRVSMGTVFMVDWTFAGDKYGGWPEPGLQKIKDAGFTTVAMALSDQAVTLDDPVLQGHEKLAVLMGNEEFGLKPETLKMCDYVATIPMGNGVDSLNVAAASAVACWELRKKPRHSLQ